MAIQTVNAAKGWMASLNSRRLDLAAEDARIERERIRISGELQGETREFKRRLLQQQQDRLEERAEHIARELKRIDIDLKAASANVLEARASAPARGSARKKLEALLHKLSAEGLGISEDLSHIAARIKVLQAGAKEVHALRIQCGLPRAESWLPLENAKLSETIWANLQAWAGDNGSPRTMRLPDGRGPKHTLEELFSIESLSAYLEADDDDESTEPPRAA